MSETTDIGATAIERVAAEIRRRDRFLLTAHEGPDGDALDLRRHRAGCLAHVSSSSRIREIRMPVSTVGS